jgi:hypothetical protein
MTDEYNGRLGPYCDKRIRVTATFERYGCRYGLYGRSVETALVRHVALETSGDIVAEHTWLPSARGLRDLGLRGGDRIAFEATVGKYQKRVEAEGPTKLVVTYGLRSPSDITLLSRLTRLPASEEAGDEIEDCEPCNNDPEPVPPEAAPPAEPTTPPAAAAPSAAGDPVAMIATVKRTAEFVGGWDRLRQLVDLLGG